MTITLTIAGKPPSKSNSIQLRRIRGRVIPAPNPQYTAWVKSATLQLAIQMAVLRETGITFPIAKPVKVDAVFYRDARTDLDNMAKATGDCLQKCGVLKNDRLIEEWHLSRRQPEPGKERVEISITVSGAR